MEHLGNDIFLVPLIPNTESGRAASYIINGPKNVLIETGASPSNQDIQSALANLDIAPEQVDAIIVTHIHLDHAGGAGQLMKQCSNADLLVHPNGRKHLCNPERLIGGARQVYGDDFDTLFSPILPILENRVRQVTTGDRYELGNGRELRFYETFGHARHHIIAFDSLSRGIFTGDTAGLFFDRVHERSGLAFCLPNTAPSQFDPSEMTASYDLMISLKPESLFFTHFGKAESPVDLLRSARDWIPFFGEECIEFYRQHSSLEELSGLIYLKILNYFEMRGVSLDTIDRSILEFDSQLNAQGVIAYAKHLQKIMAVAR